MNEREKRDKLIKEASKFINDYSRCGTSVVEDTADFAIEQIKLQQRELKHRIARGLREIWGPWNAETEESNAIAAYISKLELEQGDTNGQIEI